MDDAAVNVFVNESRSIITVNLSFYWMYVMLFYHNKNNTR